jgi:hypothetical protein
MARRKPGPTSSYKRNIAEKICARISSGESLRSICSDVDMPGRSTVMKWLVEPQRDDFRAAYDLARQMWADHVFDECFEIADDATNDYMDRNKDGGVSRQANTENIQRSRLRIDTRKWALGKMAPTRFGQSRTIKLDLPKIETPIDLLSGLSSVVSAVADGSITPNEGAVVASLLDAKRKAMETVDIEARVRAIEDQSHGKP